MTGRGRAGIMIQPRRGNNNNTIHPVLVPGGAGSSISSSGSNDPAALYRELVAKNYRKWFPWLIPVFVVINVALFLITMYINDCPRNTVDCVAGFLSRFSFQPLKENPLLGPSSTTLEQMGALDANKVIREHQGWRLVTCMWLHGGVLHLLANMLCLVVIGIRLEQEFGFVRIGLLYIISGLGGSLLSALFLRSNISVGASGALFGLLGGMLSELIINWSIYVNKVCTFITLVVIIVINLAMGLLPHVDNFAHIGGFLSGFFLGFVFLIRPQVGWVNQRYTDRGHSSSSPERKFKAYQCILWAISLIILIVGFTFALIMLFWGVNLNEHCSWCHYMSCVPSSKWSCNTQPASCTYDQAGNQLTLTCLNNGNRKTYTLQNPTSSQIEGLCTQACS